jgi:murein DD-endopeptidase MepM/ murein hydrolase activator NlpD
LSRLVAPLFIAALIGAAWLASTGDLSRLRRTLGVGTLFTQTPHEGYAASLNAAGLAQTALGRQWLTAATQSLADATMISLPHREAFFLPAAEAGAVAFQTRVRRGQRVRVEASVDSAAPIRLFVDLFERQDDGLDHAASADAGATTLQLEITRDAIYVLRLQPELLQDARVTVVWRSEPTLALPVQGATRSNIQSYFLAPRDGGRRDHHGVDIFARRGTPVVAAADGIVSSVGTNNLGGNVVWVARLRPRESHYYAHLDTQLVTAGTRVVAGDPIGTVGSTGNAAGGPPHLHFGIYSAGPVDPLPYLEPAVRPPDTTVAAALGERGRLASAVPIVRAGTERQRRYPAGTVVEILGASARQVRVRLPDGRSAYVAPRAVTGLTKPLRTARLTEVTTIGTAPAGGVTIDTIPPPATVAVLGTFETAMFVRTESGTTGWIR